MLQQQNPPVASSIVESARRLGISRSKFYHLLDSGEIRAFKLGNRTLVPETELQRFVSERMAAAE